LQLPETKYTQSDGHSVAYNAIGDGPIDVVITEGIVSQLELWHEFPKFRECIRRLGEFARVINFDKRGQGLSDRIDGVATLEQRTEDLRAVLDAVGSERAVILGHSEGGSMALLFAATHPERVSHVVTFSAYAKSCAAPDYPHMASYEDRFERLEEWLANWGKGLPLKVLAPELASSEAAMRLFGRMERASSSPSAMRRYFEMTLAIDIRAILDSVRMPTLVMHHRDDQQVPFANAEFLAASIPNARLYDAGPGGHFFWAGDNHRVISGIRSFVTGRSQEPHSSGRSLATVLFTDIAGSTERQNALGDAEWREILDLHDAHTAEVIELYRGRLVKTTGDGSLSIFDGPGRAVQCACALVEKIAELGIEIRAGIHTGEIELRGDDISGAAVHAASRIEEAAAPREVLVSHTVVDLTAGNDVIRFEEKERQALRGLPGEWSLFRAQM
jgi:class 3 adenylate cyclase/pimeloyl-ACP methyl ester carboxylesterase